MMALGNVSVSSLLRSAQASAKKQRAYEDSLASFEWSLSAKTYNEFVEYSKYIEGRLKQSTDPSEALGYQRDIVSARKGFVSNEVQRQSMNILEGRGTSTDKYNNMVNLYYQAAENGDYDLAQSLRSQLDSLSIKIQNEMESAQRAAGTMALNGVKSLEGLVKVFEKGNDYVQLPDGRFVKSLGLLESELAQSGETEFGYFDELYQSIQALQEVVLDAYEGASTQEAADRIERLYNKIQDGISTAAGDLTPEEIEMAYRSVLANNPLYSVETFFDESSGQARFRFTKNKVDDFVWIRNDDGTYQAIQTRTPAISNKELLSTKINPDGQIVEDGDTSWSIESRLGNIGIRVVSGGDNPTVQLPTGEIVQIAINPDGTVRYFGQPGEFSGAAAGLYEINPLSGQVREVAPDEVSDFGDRYSSPSIEGRNIALQLAGVSRPQKLDRLSGQINVTLDPLSGLGDTSGRSVAATTNMLQGADNTRKKIADELKKRETARLAQQTADARALQNTAGFNLNQTPVRQRSVSGAPVKQLQVAKPKKQPTVVVKALPKKTISKVGYAQPKAKIVGVAAPKKQPQVVVR